MQLFTIGLLKLNEDGTPVIDLATGKIEETYTNEDIESFARAWTGFSRQAVRGNYETITRGSSDNRLDPMYIEPNWRDPFPKSNLYGGYIGDGYIPCTDLPPQSFLMKGAKYRLLGSKSSPELMLDPEEYSSGVDNISRVELVSGELYDRLHNGGSYELTVELENDLVCTGTECDVDTIRVVKVGSVYYEFVERACIQMAFYDNGKQIQRRANTDQGQMCSNSDLAHAREACCRQERVSEVRVAEIITGETHFYDGERMSYATAKERCVSYGKDLCVYEGLNNYGWKTGYHWTNKDCSISVKINSEGRIAIVHDAMSTFIDTIPWLVEEKNTLNWFRVFWDGNDYPGSSETNTCEVNGCSTMDSGDCLCKTTVAENVVFNDLVNVSKEDVMAQLFIGAAGAPDGSASNDLGNGVTAHSVNGNIDTSTVFQVEDKGRTLFLKNVLSTVSLEGWTMPPQVYEADVATVVNAVSLSNIYRNACLRIPIKLTPPYFLLIFRI